MQHWGVDVRVDGRNILTIESKCLSGKAEFTDEEKETIRVAGMNLLGFIGERIYRCSICGGVVTFDGTPPTA